MLLSIFKNIVTSCCINIIVNKFFFLKNTIKNNFILKKHSFIFKISKHLQLRKINGFLKLKVIMLLLEIFIFSTLHLKIKITLKNVFLNKGLFIYPVMGSLAKKEILRFQFYTIFFSTYFFCSELLANYIAKLLVIGKQHLKILKRFILFFESFFYNNILVLQGLQLRITGKLGGKMRASKFHYKIGVVNLQSIISSCNYEMATAFTKYGVLSIKL